MDRTQVGHASWRRLGQFAIRGFETGLKSSCGKSDAKMGSGMKHTGFARRSVRRAALKVGTAYAGGLAARFGASGKE